MFEHSNQQKSHSLNANSQNGQPLNPKVSDTLSHKLNNPLDNSVYQFLFMQLIFWLFTCFISLFTLTLWYGQYDWNYIGHMLLQAFLGLVLSIPLHWLLLRIWQKSIAKNISYSIILVILVSFVWTLLRIQTFMHLTEEKNIWQDFGGWYFGSIFIFLFWAGLFYVTNFYKLLQREHNATLIAQGQAQREQLKRIKAQSIAKDAQMKMLRYQLNPHFLYNTLNAINALVEFEENDKAQNVIIKLSQFLRHSLESTPNIETTLAEELFILTLFLDIEKARFGDRLQFDFSVTAPAKLAKIPSLLLQPIIENSMKHAIAKNELGGTITLTANIANDKLVIELSDSGSGIKIDRDNFHPFSGKGIGLHNINSRLQTVYDKDYLFDMSISEQGSLKTRIEIPCHYPHQDNSYSSYDHLTSADAKQAPDDTFTEVKL